MIYRLYGQNWVLAIYVIFFHLLEDVSIDVIHEQGKGSSTISLTKFLIIFHLINSIPKINDKLNQKPKRILTKLVLNFY